MKIAVTGATGFLGRHLIDEVLRLDRHEVTAVFRREPIPWWNNQRNLRAIKLDISQSFGDTDPMAAIGHPDILIHLAWNYLDNYRSLLHFEEEVPKHYRFLKGLVESGLSNLIVAGTCLEYGLQNGKLSEDLPAMPTTAYGHAKDILRRQLECLRSSHSYELTWLRLFYFYGEGSRRKSLFSQLESTVKKGEKTFKMSGGEQLRDYLNVLDVAKMVSFLAECSEGLGIVNVCSGVPISVRKLVENLISAKGWDITPQLGCYPYPDYEPMAFWGDPSKLRSILGENYSLSSEMKL